jgi:protein-L-isoaspartate O-methyltransferase
MVQLACTVEPRLVMRYRVLSVGIDPDLLKTRQAVLASCGYDSLIATLHDLDEKLRSGRFDLVILSAMLSQKEKSHIQAKLPAGSRALVLETLVWPDELLRMVAEALE